MPCWRRKPRSSAGADDVLVIFADTPLIRPQTLVRMRAALARARPSWCSAFGRSDPTGYGRLVLDGGELVAIREELDASEAERAIDLCNGGLMAFAGEHGARDPDADRQPTTARANSISPTQSPLRGR